jgi:DNA-binding NtrC family response regulator
MTHTVEYGPRYDMRDIQPGVPERVVPLLIGATVEEIERELVLQTLARCEGNRTHAARLLGFSVRTLRNKIRQYAADGLDVPAHSHAGTPDDG